MRRPNRVFTSEAIVNPTTSERPTPKRLRQPYEAVLKIGEEDRTCAQYILEQTKRSSKKVISLRQVEPFADEVPARVSVDNSSPRLRRL